MAFIYLNNLSREFPRYPRGISLLARYPRCLYCRVLPQ